ncbi:hypothetical protein IWX90DRAFT_410928 [Phyllosticta citrichinensis]|uniref:Uncharacterized protein n=1 Tax=Phyllosticta citrichinensis TaxID=1130410 RepID=A0ABR1Y6F6_9PEZI
MNHTGDIVPREQCIRAKEIPRAIHHILQEHGTKDGAYNVCLTLDWNPHRYFELKGVRPQSWVLADTTAVTGDVSGGEASRALDFLARNFGTYPAMWTLALLDKVAEQHPIVWMAQEQGKRYFARIRGHQTVIFLSTQNVQFIQAMVGILAWIGAAMHETCFGPLMYCTAFMRDEGCDGHWSQLRVSYELERVFPPEDHCWYDLFPHAVIVRGYEHFFPRHNGLMILTGHVLVGLMGGPRIVVSTDGRALLRSRFALLIPTRFDDVHKMMTWRLVRKEGDDAWDAEPGFDEREQRLVWQLWRDPLTKIGPLQLLHAKYHFIDGPRRVPTISYGRVEPNSWRCRIWDLR